MCGIAGIVGQGWDRRQLHAMQDAQHHRGPDDQGLYFDPGGRVGLSHNRLSIIDLSAAGHQPMANPDETVWIVFNGEIYNYRELRAELDDYPYRSQTDTEVLLAAYERWGERCVEHLIGMFAFAIWDARIQRLYCARDRLGIKPFHYAWHQGCFLFASEIKAILAAGHPAAPNWNIWATYLSHGYYDHSADTFFEGVQTLPPGHCLTVQNGVATSRHYWDLPTLASEPLRLDDEVAAARFREIFEGAVRLRLRSDVPLGVNLSGGLDSASLMVVVDDLLQSAGEVQTFTASFDDPRYDERELASEVPRHTHWARHLQRLDEKHVWQVTWEALWHQEAPFGGISTLAYHHLHRLAQDCQVTVLLEGQGVDEMLAGYRYFRPFYLLDLLEQKRWYDLRRELRADNGSGRRALDALRQLRMGRMPNVYQDGTPHLQPRCIHREVRTLAGASPRFSQPFATHLANALYRDLRHTKLPRVLRMNDRLSMAFGRELREPYLDHRVVEFLFRLPGSQKIRLGQSKFLLRQAMAERLPDRVRLAGKRSVVTPQREWLRTVLRPQVEDLIHSRSFAERGLFDVSEVQATYRTFCDGQHDNAFFVWQWVNTELWFRRFIDGNPAAA